MKHIVHYTLVFMFLKKDMVMEERVTLQCFAFHIMKGDKLSTLVNTSTNEYMGHVIQVCDGWRAYLDYKSFYKDLGVCSGKNDAIKLLWNGRWDYHQSISPICGYCGAKSIMKPIGKRVMYECDNCDTRTGSHIGTFEPLGTLADRELGRLRNEAHKAFDPFWQDTTINRNAAYRWLAKQLGIPVDECHMGLFDESMCKKAIEVCGYEN